MVTYKYQALVKCFLCLWDPDTLEFQRFDGFQFISNYVQDQ